MAGPNEAWDLTAFLEALTAELDRARDLLRLKSVNRPLTYTVNDVGLQLNVFAEYDGDRVRFRTAQPGEEGFSQIDLKLGSITDRLVAETTKALPTSEDQPFDGIAPEVLGPDQRRELKKLGVESKRDLDRLAKRKVRHGDVDFADLAMRMEQASRPRKRPRIDRVMSFETGAGRSLIVYGSDLDEVDPGSVLLNERPVASTVRPDAVEVTLYEQNHTGDLRFRTLGGELMRVRLVE